MEALEVVNEVRRLRPEWLRQFPDTREEARLDTFWTKEVWRLARKSDELHLRHKREEHIEETASVVLRQMKNTRKSLLASKGDWSALDYSVALNDDNAPAWYVSAVPPEGSVEGWRMDGEGIFWNQLAEVPRKRSTYADWVGMYVDLERMTSSHADFARFWFREVDKARMHRSWIRSVGGFALSQVKVTGGHPSDNQHMAYLPDCDVLVTRDENFGKALGMVRKAADFEFADIVVVESTDPQAILDALVVRLAVDR
jgi:hypothetical protein